MKLTWYNAILLYYNKRLLSSLRKWKGFALNPSCSQNICPLSGTNQSEETNAITNQAAW